MLANALRISFLAVVLAAPLAAQGNMTAPPDIQFPNTMEGATKAYFHMEEQAASTKLVTDKLRALNKEHGREAREMDEYKELMVRYRAASKVMRSAEESFFKAFEATDWNGWKNKEILEAGLLGVGRMNMSHHPEQAIKAFDALLEQFPSASMAEYVRTSLLPGALLGSSDIRAARKRIVELGADADDKTKPIMKLYEGDALAIEGRLDEAVVAYQAALDGMPEDLPRSDPRARHRRSAAQRVALVGKSPSEIDSKQWQGGNAMPLSTLASMGGVIVLDFWATWCGPCRDVMPGMDDLYNEKASEGLQILGITRYYENGFIPESRDEMQAGERLKDITEEDYEGHLEDFRNATGIRYPFVVADKQAFKDYQVSGIPTVVIIGRDGRIRFVMIGSGNEVMFRNVVVNALAESAPQSSRTAGK